MIKFINYLKEARLKLSSNGVNDQYVKKLHSMSHQNPIGSGHFFYLKDDDGEDALVNYRLISHPDHVYLTDLEVGEGKTGKGFGDYVMKTLTKEADKMGVEIRLFPEPLKYRDADGKTKKMPKNKLVNFYKKHGFTFMRDDRATMQRKPK